MKVCIIGNSLVSLTLAKALTNMGISVDIFFTKKQNIPDSSRTLGISSSNVDFFNKHILNIEKILWSIKNIKIFTENFSKNEILNFSNSNKNLFSILKNLELYKMLNAKLKKEKLLKFYKAIDYKNIKKRNYKLIITCDSNHEITKKFFSKRISKDYYSRAYTTIVTHKKIINNVAIQIFTRDGPIAYLPISNTQTSVVYSFKKRGDQKIDIKNLIKKFNPKFAITNIKKIKAFELRSSNLRKYYKNNILAFGDMLHQIHPLAGQGFNMSIRDIKNLINIINNKIDLGLDLDKQICEDFQNQTKVKNYIFSSGIDGLYEFFNLESKIKNNFVNKSISLIGKNKLVNNFFREFADEGFK